MPCAVPVPIIDVPTTPRDLPPLWCALLQRVHVQASPTTAGDTAETANGERPPSFLVNDNFADAPADPSGGGGSTELQPEYAHFTNGVLTSARACACA